MISAQEVAKMAGSASVPINLSTYEPLSQCRWQVSHDVSLPGSTFELLIYALSAVTKILR